MNTSVSWSCAPCTPLSALRAAARTGGGGCYVQGVHGVALRIVIVVVVDAQGGVFLFSPPLVPSIPRLTPVPYTDVAPLSTPRAIACGSGWGCFMVQVSLSPLPPSCLISPHRSTHQPPHKQ